MSKPTLLFRGPVETRSGYGAHARDLLHSLHEMDLFDIKIDSCAWGHTPRTALEVGNEFHDWIKKTIIKNISQVPDFYVQVTVPNEFQKLGKFNIGVTAGIETTIAPKNWIDGCNQMDLVITTSKFSKDVLLQTVYNETEKLTGKLVSQYRITKPIEVLFEGVDTTIFNNQGGEFDLDIKEDFAYLFVGHWLKGNLGQDRKDVGMLIRCFMESFNVCAGFNDPPSVYLLFGELTENEMNSLYNHPKVKSMVSITKGEGFGRPLLEFSMTGKPIIASNWSGHKDFLPMDKAIMIGGKLVEVDDSVVDDFIIKGSKSFEANYNEFIEVLRVVMKDYDNFKNNSEELRRINSENFSLSKMTDKFKQIITPYFNSQPKEHKLVLPKLTKVK